MLHNIIFLTREIKELIDRSMDKTKERTVSAPERDLLDQMPGYQLRRAAAFSLNDFVSEFADVPLRQVSFGMLALIEERDGISSAELGRVLGMQRANLVPLIAELEERGLIERRDHPNDKRIQVLFLTPAAKKEMPGWRQRVRLHENRVLSRLTKSEKATLVRLLNRIWTDDEG
jgi:DNA-binding MarR family transcriptional regulator